MTVTLETLRADYDDVDFTLIDLIERLKIGFDRNQPQAPEYHRDMTELFDILSMLPVAKSAAIACHVLGGLRLIFDPKLVPSYDKHSELCRSYILESEGDPHSDGRLWTKGATLALIAVRHGLQAAMLYKLSDGAIDPRKAVQ